MVGLTGARFGGAARRRRRAAKSAKEDDSGVATHRRQEQPLIGQTGARFSAASRRRRKPRDFEPEDSGPFHTEQPRRVTDSRPVDPFAGLAWAESIELAERDAATKPEGMVRPYSWTGGRTASRLDLPVEALVSATGRPVEPTAPPEHSTIVRLCDVPRSVAEFAALLTIPLGVARVVLGDMAEAGTIMVHRSARPPDSTPDLGLMRRVLNGLQRL